MIERLSPGAHTHEPGITMWHLAHEDFTQFHSTNNERADHELYNLGRSELSNLCVQDTKPPEHKKLQ